MKLMPSLAILTLVLASPVAAGQQDARFFLSSPVVENFVFNGIEGRASLAMTPPDEARPLSARQVDLLKEYRRLEEACRGSRPGPETDNACAARDSLDLTKAGICFGLENQSMAESEWHACRVSSYGYKLGSESVSIACRPGEMISLTFFFRNFNDFTSVGESKGSAISEGGEVPTTYSVNAFSGRDGERISAQYAFDTSGTGFLRALYDGGRIVLPLGTTAKLTLGGTSSRKVRDELARAYAGCR